MSKRAKKAPAYSRLLGERIIAAMLASPETTLRRAAVEHGLEPTTVHEWSMAHSDFREKVELARREQMGQMTDWAQEKILEATSLDEARLAMQIVNAVDKMADLRSPKVTKSATRVEMSEADEERLAGMAELVADLAGPEQYEESFARMLTILFPELLSHFNGTGPRFWPQSPELRRGDGSFLVSFRSARAVECDGADRDRFSGHPGRKDGDGSDADAADDRPEFPASRI